MKPLVLIRPEPGLSASAARAEALGLEVVRWPLFQVEPVAWTVPDSSDVDAILLTSANAVRMAGSGLSQLLHLPAYAVGAATAAAARDAGFSIADVGEVGVDALLKRIPAETRLLHLAGEDRITPSITRQVTSVTVYRSVALEQAPPIDLAGAVVVVHSPRAGTQLAALVADRISTSIAAISGTAAGACGAGWQLVAVADKPDDAALLSLAAKLCQTGDR